jgi:threonine/homoserine/homoserine lactone efflux protein
MDGYPLIGGVLVGLSIAAPIGPIGILCIRRTLVRGRLSGLVSGLGAATADGLYGIIAVFGLTVVSQVIIRQMFLLRIIGGVVLIVLGIRIFFSKLPEKSAASDTGNLIHDYWTTLFLTLTNPLTILSFAAIFAVFGIGSSHGDTLSSSLIVIGVIAGSAIWWILLTTIIAGLQSGINDPALVLVNRVSGTLIAAFGIIALAVTFV